MHTLTQAGCYWLLGSHLAAVLAGAVGSVCGGGGEGVDYDELQRNTANSGFMRMLGKKTQRDIFERNTPQM